MCVTSLQHKTYSETQNVKHCVTKHLENIHKLITNCTSHYDVLDMTIHSVAAVPMFWIITNILIGQYKISENMNLEKHQQVNLQSHSLYEGINMIWVIPPVTHTHTHILLPKHFSTFETVNALAFIIGTHQSTYQHITYLTHKIPIRYLTAINLPFLPLLYCACAVYQYNVGYINTTNKLNYHCT
jgi:hypothetical protein